MDSHMIIIKLNQIFHYTRCITPKRVTRWRGPSSRHSARATQLLSKKCRSGSEAFGNTMSNLTALDLNLRHPAAETNALPVDELVGILQCHVIIIKLLIKNKKVRTCNISK